jgi:hypothetical protein
VNKTLRIFAKDARHLWPEILLTLGLTFGFAATTHYNWPAYAATNYSEAGTIVLWMNALLPVAWWLLIARAVHDESLVGDLQFWVTRPYGWPRLLAAKLLFIATFIVLPFLLAQCYLLHQAGLHPLAVIPGLLLRLLLLVAFILLPLLALSTVTPSLTRMLLIYLALIIYLVLVTYLGHLSGKSHPWVPSSGEMGWELWLIILLIPTAAAVVTFLQYARRRTAFSISLLVTLVIVSTIAMFLYTHRDTGLEGFTPLASNAAPPIQIAFNPDPALQVTYAPGSRLDEIAHSEDMHVGLPVILSGIAPGHAIELQGVLIDSNDPNTVSTPLGWQMNRGMYTPSPTGSEQTRQEIFFLHSDRQIVSFTLTYALADYVAETPTTVSLLDNAFDAPDHGHCTLNDNGRSLDCQYAVAFPSRTLVSYTLQQTCGVHSHTDLPESQWIGSDSRFLPDFSPVISNGSLTTFTSSKSQPYVHLCPGALITFTRYRLAARQLIPVRFPSIDPRHYLNPDEVQVTQGTE